MLYSIVRALAGVPLCQPSLEPCQVFRAPCRVRNYVKRVVRVFGDHHIVDDSTLLVEEY